MIAMLHKIKGKLVEKTPFRCVIEVGFADGTALAFEVRIPLSTFEALPELGEDVELYVHSTISKDNEPVLYGFIRESERFIFRKLLQMPGIGPSLALRVLSGLTPSELLTAVRDGDISRLSSIKGIGKRRAERISFELKGRVEELLEEIGRPTRPQVPQEILEQAIEALIALGLTDSEARSALENAVSQIESVESLSVEQLIRLALSSGRSGRR